MFLALFGGATAAGLLGLAVVAPRALRPVLATGALVFTAALYVAVVFAI
ncbi:hypothetical protein [Streptomyces sp. NBC_01262]|nr:hypothetical protein [Streptomyces sp. NBC_01262]